MDSNTLAKPQAARLGNPEFDPSCNAKPCSPFYVYNHDSPRPSTDHKSKPSFNMSVRDLESGSEVLTPSVTQEKQENTVQPQSRLAALQGRLLPKRCQQHMTKPKQKNWLQRMPKKQRITVKLLIALVLIGCMVGIAVGIAAGLRSGVWKSNNQQGDIKP